MIIIEKKLNLTSQSLNKKILLNDYKEEVGYLDVPGWSGFKELKVDINITESPAVF